METYRSIEHNKEPTSKPTHICPILSMKVQKQLNGIPIQWKKDICLFNKQCQSNWIFLSKNENWKRSVFIPIPKKGNAKECSNYHTIVHLTHQQSSAQNSPRKASTVCELRTSRCSRWIQKRQRNQRSNCQHLLGHQ